MDNDIGEEKQDNNCTKRLYLAVNARRLEIELFWRRSLFFWGFIAAALVALAATHGEHPRLELLISCFGLVCSVCWSLANRGSKYWHEAWETKVHREEKAIGEPLFSRTEDLQNKGPWLSARRYSVSKLAILLSDYTCFAWLSITIFLVATVIDWTSLADVWHKVVILLFILATMLFIFLVIYYGRSTQADEPTLWQRLFGNRTFEQWLFGENPKEVEKIKDLR